VFPRELWAVGTLRIHSGYSLLFSAACLVLDCKTGSLPSKQWPTPNYYDHIATHLFFVRVKINLTKHPQESDLFSSSWWICILRKASCLALAARGCLVRFITSRRGILPKPATFFIPETRRKQKRKPSQLSRLERAQVTWVPALPLFCWCFCAGRFFSFFFFTFGCE